MGTTTLANVVTMRPGTPIRAIGRARLIAAASGLAVAFLSGCAEQPDEARQIVDAAIDYQGGEFLDRTRISFDLRGRHYRVTRDRGRFTYERIYTDSTGNNIHDILNNDGLYRERNGERVELDSAQHRSALVGVNSTVYFALLPYPLQDPAVRTQYLGTAAVGDANYHEIEVTFVPEGGGLDYEDRFVYWIGTDVPVVDYLAYYYFTEGGGSRFRRAVNKRRVGGILFSDYENYAAPRDSNFTDIHVYDALFEQDSLSLVSTIDLENIRVFDLDDEGW